MSKFTHVYQSMKFRMQQNADSRSAAILVVDGWRPSGFQVSSQQTGSVGLQNTHKRTFSHRHHQMTNRALSWLVDLTSSPLKTKRGVSSVHQTLMVNPSGLRRYRQIIGYRPVDLVWAVGFEACCPEIMSLSTLNNCLLLESIEVNLIAKVNFPKQNKTYTI